MQTSFTDKQLLDKDNKSSESILRKCVHCGMCNATCPTFLVNGNELEGPRGRIYLIKDMLENKKPANEKIAQHIDSCLSCYACMTTCPSGVNYMHLIDHGRNHVEKTYKRPFLEKLMRNVLSFILPNPGIFKIMIFLTRIIKPLNFIFPKFIKNSLALIPNNFPKKNLKIKKIYSPENKKVVARVALLTGCVQRVISPEINESTIRLLNRHNVEVVVLPEIKCCGSLNHHLGKKDLAHSSFSKNINLWHEEYLKNGLDAMNHDDCTRVAQNKSSIYGTYIESQTYDPVDFTENIVRITNGTCESEGYETLSTQVSNILLSNLFLNFYILKLYSNYYNFLCICYRNVS